MYSLSLLFFCCLLFTLIMYGAGGCRRSHAARFRCSLAAPTWWRRSHAVGMMRITTVTLPPWARHIYIYIYTFLTFQGDDCETGSTYHGRTWQYLTKVMSNDTISINTLLMSTVKASPTEGARDSKMVPETLKMEAKDTSRPYRHYCQKNDDMWFYIDTGLLGILFKHELFFLMESDCKSESP